MILYFGFIYLVVLISSAAAGVALQVALEIRNREKDQITPHFTTELNHDVAFNKASYISLVFSGLYVILYLIGFALGASKYYGPAEFVLFVIQAFIAGSIIYAALYDPYYTEDTGHDGTYFYYLLYGNVKSYAYYTSTVLGFITLLVRVPVAVANLIF